MGLGTMIFTGGAMLGAALSVGQVDVTPSVAVGILEREVARLSKPRTCFVAYGALRDVFTRRGRVGAMVVQAGRPADLVRRLNRIDARIENAAGAFTDCVKLEQRNPIG